MRPILHKITVDASRDEVVDVVERYKSLLCPLSMSTAFWRV